MRTAHILLIILIAAATSFAVARWTGPEQSAAAAPETESVYARVMRTGTLRCSYAVWPPYLTKDPNTKQVGGIGYDIVEEVGRELSLDVEWVEEVGYGNFIEGLNTNRYDMMCATVWPDGARSKNATLTQPVFYNAQFAYVRADDDRFDGNLAAINDPAVTVSAIEGDVTHNIALVSYPKAQVAALPQMADASQMLMDVTSRKADVTFVDVGLAQSFMQNNPGALKRVENAPPVRVFGEVFALKRGEYHMKHMLDSVIETLNNSGVIPHLLAQYPSLYMAAAKGYEPIERNAQVNE